MSDSQGPWADLLLRLLGRLDQVGRDHEELHDTVAREAMRDALARGFVAGQGSFEPSTYELFDEASDEAVRTAIREYVEDGRALAEQQGLDASKRLAVLQDGEVVSPDGNHFDDYLGWIDPQHLAKWLGP